MEPTMEEKINYIYEKIKSDTRKRNIWLVFKWWIRLLIPIFIAYMYFFGFSMMINSIKTTIKESLKIDTWKISETKDSVINSVTNTLQDLCKKNTFEY